MIKLLGLLSFVAFGMCSTAALAGDAQAIPGDRGCYYIQVKNISVWPERIGVSYTVEGHSNNFYTDLNPFQSEGFTVAGSGCWRLGDIKIAKVSSHRINPDGSIGSEDFNMQTENLIRQILEHNQRVDAQNRENLERQRLADEARKQRELDLEAARERSEAEAQRIFALGRDQQLQSLRQMYPGCIIPPDYTSADIALCSSAANLIREDKLRAEQAAREWAEQQALLAANAAKAEADKALHDQYLAQGQNDPCWAADNYAKYHPQPVQDAATNEQIRAALEQSRLMCAARK